MTVVTAAYVSPGDRVLLTVADAGDVDHEALLGQLRERFPGVEFTVVTGVTGVAVQREGDDCD